MAFKFTHPWSISVFRLEMPNQGTINRAQWSPKTLGWEESVRKIFRLLSPFLKPQDSLNYPNGETNMATV